MRREEDQFPRQYYERKPVPQAHQQYQHQYRPQQQIPSRPLQQKGSPQKYRCPENIPPKTKNKINASLIVSIIAIAIAALFFVLWITKPEKNNNKVQSAVNIKDSSNTETEKKETNQSKKLNDATLLSEQDAQDKLVKNGKVITEAIDAWTEYFADITLNYVHELNDNNSLELLEKYRLTDTYTEALKSFSKKTSHAFKDFIGFAKFCPDSKKDFVETLKSLYALEIDIFNIGKDPMPFSTNNLKKMDELFTQYSELSNKYKELAAQPQESPKDTTDERTQVWDAGTLKVGTDIPAGTYVISSSGDFYWEITKDSTGSSDSIIANGNAKHQEYITVFEGQYLTSQAKIYSLDDAPICLPVKGRLDDGTYAVGRDIDAGEYVVNVPNPNKTGYFEVLSDATHLPESIVTNANFNGSKYVTVEKGQYIHISEAYLVLN